MSLLDIIGYDYWDCYLLIFRYVFIGETDSKEDFKWMCGEINLHDEVVSVVMVDILETFRIQA